MPNARIKIHRLEASRSQFREAKTKALTNFSRSLFRSSKLFAIDLRFDTAFSEEINGILLNKASKNVATWSSPFVRRNIKSANRPSRSDPIIAAPAYRGLLTDLKGIEMIRDSHRITLSTTAEPIPEVARQNVALAPVTFCEVSRRYPRAVPEAVPPGRMWLKESVERLIRKILKSDGNFECGSKDLVSRA